MSNIKALLKKTPLINLWRSFRRKAEYDRLMHYNNLYKKHIDPFLDPDNLKNSLETYKERTDKTKTCYIIGIRHDKTGIFGYINNYLPHIAYALSKGYVPVIDMKNYPNIYQAHDENSWEKFYEQPCEIDLDQISSFKKKNGPDDLWYRWAPNTCPLMDDETIKMWGTIYQYFVRYNTQTSQYLENEFESILKDPTHTLGAIFRGTDYSKGKPIGCPVQPTKEQFCDKIEEMMLSNNCNYVYIASDEKEIVDYMNQRFPGKVLINKRVYYDEVTNVDYSNYNNDHIGISGAHFDRDNNEYLIGIEYISSIYLVSKCSYFVAGACGSSTAALYLNNCRYKEKYIFELGKYTKDS